MVSLQCGTLLALSKDNGSVQNFVELGQVKQPAEIRETLIPHAPRLVGRSGAFSQQGGVCVCPLEGLWVVHGSIAIAMRAIEPAHGIYDSRQAVGFILAGPRGTESTQHAHERPCGVDCKEDIVDNDEELECLGLAERIRLESTTGVDTIQKNDGGGIDGGDGNWDTPIQGLPVH